MSQGNNWRSSSSTRSAPLLNYESNNPFGKSLQKKNDQRPVKRSFNKKIVIQKSNQKRQTYKQLNNISFTTTKIKKKEQVKPKIMLPDSWDDETPTVYEEIENKYAHLKSHDHPLSKRFWIFTLSNVIQSGEITKEEQQKIDIIDEQFKLQNYLMLNGDELDNAYTYYKQTGFTFSQFICEFNYDKLIEMDEKDLFKLKRNISKGIKSIKKIKMNKNPNKQQLEKLKRENEYLFKKNWIHFYTNCISTY